MIKPIDEGSREKSEHRYAWIWKLGLAFLALAFAFRCGHDFGTVRVATLAKSEVYVDDKLDPKAIVYRYQDHIPIVCVDKVCYRLGPVGILKPDAGWNLGGSIYMYRRLYGSDFVEVTDITKYEGAWNPKVVQETEKIVSFTDPKGRRIRAKLDFWNVVTSDDYQKIYGDIEGVK